MENLQWWGLGHHGARRGERADRQGREFGRAYQSKWLSVDESLLGHRHERTQPTALTLTWLAVIGRSLHRGTMLRTTRLDRLGDYSRFRGRLVLATGAGKKRTRRQRQSHDQRAKPNQRCAE